MIQISKHFSDMLAERMIDERWVESALSDPDRVDHGEDGNLHYIKRIPERDGRTLRVVVNPQRTPAVAVTVFFDRRLS